LGVLGEEFGDEDRVSVPGLFITGTDTGVGKTYVAALIARWLAASGRRVGVYKPAASGCVRDDQGRLVSDDAVALWEAAGRPGDLEHVCPQCFVAPLAPHLAARAEGREIDAGLLRTGLDYWRSRCEIVLVEGAGGLMSPLGDEEYVADLAGDLGFPLIVVSRNILGTINATLQTLIAAAVYGNGLVGIAHCRVGGARESLEDGALREPVENRGEHFQGFNFVRNPPFSHRFASRTLQAGENCGLRVAGVVLNHPSPPSAGDLSLASNRAELAARCAAPLLAAVAFGAKRFDGEVDWFGMAKSC
jgi:dethiobiotin synthetase